MISDSLALISIIQDLGLREGLVRGHGLAAVSLDVRGNSWRQFSITRVDVLCVKVPGYAQRGYAVITVHSTHLADCLGIQQFGQSQSNQAMEDYTVDYGKCVYEDFLCMSGGQETRPRGLTAVALVVG